MAHSIYSSAYVYKFGYGVLVVDGPTLSDNTHRIRCHVMFTEDASTYAFADLSYDSDVKDHADEGSLLDAARTEGVNRLREVLEARDSLHYKAIMKGNGFDVVEQPAAFLLQLHMRLRINKHVEESIQQHAIAPDLKARMGEIIKAPTITRTSWVE